MQDITQYRVVNVVAVQNYGRSGSTFLQSLLDGHPNILSTPNFYSRAYYEKWEEKIAHVPDEEKQAAFIEQFPQWFDTAYVDQSAGLHRLGPDQNQIAHVDRERFEGTLAAYFEHNEVNRKNLFIGTHLAYALCLDRELAHDLWTLYPIHGRPISVARALLEDFPEAKFVYTVREPVSNVASSLSHFRTSNVDYKSNPVEATLRIQFSRNGREGHELFGDRPYLEQLAEAGQTTAVRLEDLHAQSENVMRSLVIWLGLPWHECLLDSTFDGKKWWNRPESPKQSGFGGQMLGRNVRRRLSALDRFRIRTIARPKAGMWGYDLADDSRLSALWRAGLFMVTVLVPWKEEQRTATSPFRVFQMLVGWRRYLPSSLRARIDEQLKREERRYTYLSFDNGVRGIRAKRDDRDKPAWVQCMIVLFPDPENADYRGKIYEDFPVPEDRANCDYAIVRFADEIASRPDRRTPLDGLRMLMSAGRIILRLRDYVAIRYWTIRAYVQSRRDRGQEVTLLEIVRWTGSAADDPTAPANMDAPRPDSISAA